MSQVTELSVSALPGMVHSFVAKIAAVATVSVRYDLVGTDESKFGLVGASESKFGLVGTDESKFNLVGA